jgi:hypothetical protein
VEQPDWQPEPRRQEARERRGDAAPPRVRGAPGGRGPRACRPLSPRCWTERTTQAVEVME